MRLTRFAIYMTVVSIANVVLCHAADRPSVQWSETGTLNAAQKEVYEDVALDICRKAGIRLSEHTNIRARFNARIEFANLHLPAKIEVVLRDRDTECEMGFFPPDNLRLASFRNVQAERSMHAEGDMRHADASRRWKEEESAKHKGEFHTYIQKKNKESDVIERGKRLLVTMANVDLGKWKFFSCYYVRGGWEMWYKAKVAEYVAPGYHLLLVLADNDTLDVVSFNSNAYKWPQPKNMEIKVLRSEARELGEQYLKKYYHQRELATLRFSTNKLEVITPNYAFTPQDHGDDAVTNAPTLAWVSVFEREENTLTRSPVFIFVDAGDGAMLGGYE